MTTAKMDKGDLIESLCNLENFHERSGFNDAAKFGVLRNAVVSHSELAQFAAFRGALTYVSLHTALKDYATSKTTFGQVIRSSSPKPARSQDYPTSID